MVLLTSFEPKLKDNTPPMTMTTRKLRISFVLRERGGNFIIMNYLNGKC